MEQTKTYDYFESHLNPDAIKARLESVNRRLARPAFLHDLTCSRLPSQAASDTSLSPGEFPTISTVTAQANRHSHLSVQPTSQPTKSSPLVKAIDFAYTQPRVTELEVDKYPDVEAFTLEYDFRSGDAALTGHPGIEGLQQAIVRAWNSLGSVLPDGQKAMSERGFTSFEHGHNDLVLAVDFNFYGTRMVTASSDHRLKVWDRKDESWSLIDTWRAHDAEIVDVKWNGPFTGSIIGSIGEDGRFNLWEEDLLESPHSSRRFKRIFTVRSITKVPFCSLDFKNLHTDTYAALITRDGHLTMYEPVDHDNLGGEWNAVYERYQVATPKRDDETGFRVSWHKEKVPCWTAVEAGLDRKALSLAVAAMDKVKIYRTDKERNWYQAVELLGARSIIRDVAWANGAMRGYDIIATASKDGAVRIYEISTPSDRTPRTGADSSPQPGGANRSPHSSGKNQRAAIQSGLAAGLANTSSSGSREFRDTDRNTPGRIKQEARRVAELTAHNGPVWRLAFSQLGDLLVSTGDDGSVKTWKKAMNDQWLEYSQIELAATDT